MDARMDGDASFLWNEESWREDYAGSAKVSVARRGDKKKKRNEKQKKIGRNGMKRGSEGVEMVSAVRRSWIANSRGKVAVVYATGDGH